MYYNIENRTDKEVGNVFPQVDCLNLQLAHSIQLNQFINTDSELIYKIKQKAKLTNFLSQAAISALGFLMDEKTKRVIQQFNIIPHNYNAAIVHDQTGMLHPYFWLHLGDELKNIDWLDYENSTFFLEEYGFREDDIAIKSYADFLKKNKEVGDMSVICIDKIHIKRNFEITQDLFSLPRLTRKIFISERLKVALEKNQISGILIEEAFG